MTTIPDYISPFYGWRSWFIDDRFRLLSVIQDAVWPKCKPFTAACRLSVPPLYAPRGSSLLHKAPREDCHCGIYGTTSLVEATRYLEEGRRPEALTALGITSLWGKMVQHQEGYRAQYAYPKFLVLFAPRERNNQAYIFMRDNEMILRQAPSPYWYWHKERRRDTGRENPLNEIAARVCQEYQVPVFAGPTDQNGWQSVNRVEMLLTDLRVNIVKDSFIFNESPIIDDDYITDLVTRLRRAHRLRLFLPEQPLPLSTKD